MKATIVLLPGDGIGPEVTAAAVRVLDAIAETRGHVFTFHSHAIGGAALTRGEPPLPEATLAAARTADAVFLGAVGDPRFDAEPPARRPESALLALRRELDVYANIRPLRAWPGLDDISPLKARVFAGTDFVIVRELTSGLYYGQPRGREADDASAINTMRYTRAEIERVARVAFDLARRRRRHVTSVDKANVLEVSRLWREVVTAVAGDYVDVTLAHEYVDTAAMKLALTPTAFDVVLTENMFGDILSDEAGGIAGSLGVLPSASLGRGAGLFEPVHGSAPTIAGRDIANPIGAIASAAMLLGDGLGLADDAAVVVQAIEQALGNGLRTADIAAPGAPAVGTKAFADAVARAVFTTAQRGAGAPIVA